MLKLELQYFAGTVQSGMSIVFDVDNAQFSKGLQQINKELNASSKYAKELDKAVKIDPTSVELLEKSLKQTNVQLEGSEEKSKALNKEITRLNSLDLEELNDSASKLKTEFLNSRKETQQLEKELEKLSKIDVNSEEYAKLSVQLVEAEKSSALLAKELQDVNRDIKNLDVQNMNKLAIEAQQAENQIAILSKKQKDLNNNIEGLKTEQYDKLTGATKKAVVQQGLLVQETKKTVDSNDELTSSLSGLATTGASDVISSLTESLPDASQEMISLSTNALQTAGSLSTMGPVAAGVGTAIVTLSGVLSINIKRNQENRKATKELTLAFADAEVVTNNNAKAVTNLSKAYQIESEEVIEAAKSTRSFTNENEDATRKLQKISNAIGVNESGLIDYSTQMDLTSTAQRNWNLSQNATEDVLGTSVKLIADYGKVLEDIPDVLVEWSDTFSAAGLSAEETFQILVDGADAGARSADETANALNEFILSLEEARDPTSAEAEALAALGINFDDLNSIVQNQGIGAAIDLILNSMANLTDNQTELNELMAVSGAIFGTVGEEFVYNAIVLGELGTATEGLSLSTQFLAGQSSILKTALEEQAGAISLDTYNQFAFLIDNMTLSTALLSDQIFTTMLPALSGLVETGALTQNRLDLLTQSQSLLSEAYDTGNIALLLTDANSKTLIETILGLQTQFGLTDEQIKNYTNSINNAKEASGLLSLGSDDLTKAFLNQYTQITGNDFTTKKFTTTLTSSGSAILGVEKQTTELTFAQMTQAQQTALVSSKLGSLGIDAVTASNNLKILTSSTSTSSDKTAALSDINKTLADKLLISAEQANKMSDKIAILDKAQGEAENSSSSYTEALDGGNIVLEDGSKILDTFGDAVEDGSKQFKKFSDKALDARKSTERLNSEISTFNNNPPKDQNVTITTTYKTVGTPAEGGSKSSSSGFFGRSVSANSIVAPKTFQIPYFNVPQNASAPINAGISTSNVSNDTIIQVGTLNLKSEARNIEELGQELRVYFSKVR